MFYFNRKGTRASAASCVRLTTLVLAAGLSLIVSAQTRVSAETFVDPELQTWMNQSKGVQSFSSPIKGVIVYFKSPVFHDRTGQARFHAMSEEKSFIMSFLKGKAQELAARYHIALSSANTLWSSNAIVVSLDRSALRLLSRLSEIDGIVLDREITLDEPVPSEGKVKADETEYTYGLQVINAKKAWDSGVTGESVTVGVIDTGVDATHPDLKDKVVQVKDFTDDKDGKDYIGHGTHVSGTIVGGDKSGKHIGVAPGAKILMAKVFDRKGHTTMQTLLKAMEWMVDPDADPNTKDAPRVVSNSWGSSNQFSYGFRNVVREWRRFQIFPNFAAGNSGSYFTVSAPGSYPFSFAVGAVDENRAVTFFSSRGPTVWWKNYHPIFVTKPDVSAPGLDVLSSVPGGSYARMSGTSMATPHNAGVVALALQANPNLTVENLIEILDSSALDVAGKGLNNSLGHGVVQANKVVEKARAFKVSAGSSFQDKDPNFWEWPTP